MENKAHHETSKLSYTFLKQITNDFDKERILGSGGFGTVYKGVHENREEIAVKILHYISGLDDKDFHKELNIVRGLKHPNIVEFVGFCSELEEELALFEGKQVIAQRLRMALCFEYLHNGSLNNHISDENTGLTWQTRYRIIKGICEGLKYLHEELEYPVMHLDIKPSSILLDKDMVPKIGNFGLSKLFSGCRNTTMSSAGTCGYWPPEYIKHQVISKQFDIYSLGVMIVRIMVGHENFWQTETTIRKCVTFVHKNWRKKLRQSHTPLLKVYCHQVKRCIEIALGCLESNRHERPTINDIVSKLNETETMIGEQGLQIKKFYQDDHGELISQSMGSINSGPSSGHGEASKSTYTTNSISATEPKVMTLQELKNMTGNFSEERLLGWGGYGMVYKGVLDNGKNIAVKKLHNKPGLVQDQFKNELLNLMMVQHQNIIQLVGYCSEAQEIVVEHEGIRLLASVEERALCLEYMQGGTLEELISDESGGLNWEARFKIIKGTCEGLKYLHTGCKDPICHMDLKPANIMLDRDMIPKIGDFGLSMTLGTTETYVSKTFAGTLGYMPPEYIHGQHISLMFDVFGLGVIILQVIAGRNAYNNYKSEFMPSQEFIDLVTGNWRKRVQAKPMSTEALMEVQKCIKIALRCVEDNRAKRPTITEIVEELYD